MKCPACAGKLLPSDVEGVAADRCDACHGIWIGEEGLRLAKDEAVENLVWLELDLWKDRQRFVVRGEGLDCPSCSAKLHRVRYASPDAHAAEDGSGAGVDLDYCKDCRAVWLGEGELGAIVTVMEGEASRMTSAELLQEALREAVEVLNGPEPLALEWRDLKRVLQLLKVRFFVEHPRLEKLIEDFPRGTPFS